MPTLLDRLPAGYLEAFADLAAASGRISDHGAFRRRRGVRIYNAAISLSRRAQLQQRHLVPSANILPPLFGWFYALAQIPMSDQTRGADQAPLRFGAQRSRALNISATRTSSARN